MTSLQVPIRQLSECFYKQSTLMLAPKLLGKVLYRQLPDGEWLSGRIVEVEAYHQEGDEAAHSFRGRTARNEVMFGDPGRLYVYFIYGMHYCMNVVTESAGVGAAVLIRGIEPLQGKDTMVQLRGGPKRKRDVTNGPAKCCQAFGIGPEMNGVTLAGGALVLGDGDLQPDEIVHCSQRIGISKSMEHPWRFFIAGNAFVSSAPSGMMYEPL